MIPFVHLQTNHHLILQRMHQCKIRAMKVKNIYIERERYKSKGVNKRKEKKLKAVLYVSSSFWNYQYLHLIWFREFAWLNKNLHFFLFFASTLLSFCRHPIKMGIAIRYFHAYFICTCCHLSIFLPIFRMAVPIYWKKKAMLRKGQKCFPWPFLMIIIHIVSLREKETYPINWLVVWGGTHVACLGQE